MLRSPIGLLLGRLQRVLGASRTSIPLQRRVHIRVGGLEGRLHLDLGDDTSSGNA